MLAELLADDPLPGIELEQRLDGVVVEVEETRAVPADVLDGDAGGIEARLDRGVAQVFDRAAVLGMVLRRRNTGARAGARNSSRPRSASRGGS